MPKSLSLLPMPRTIKRFPGTFTMPPKMRLHPVTYQCGGEPYALTLFVDKAATICRTDFKLSGGHGTGDNTEIRLMRDESIFPHLRPGIREQAYKITITEKVVQIRATAQPGFFYALQSLLQLIRISTNKKRQTHLPCLTIEDYPDFERRGIYHDTARGKVPKLETMLQLIDDLAHLKINEFQLYIENNFQFKKHPEMYNDTDPFTPEELQQMDQACRARHIDFVPSLTSLGHFEKILSRPRYRALAEATAEELAKTDINPAWAKQAPWSLCVTDPRSKKLLRDMYAEFLPNFSSPTFNICCDEAFDLGYGRSKPLADKIGRGRLYLNWINFCNSLARKHGKKIQLWGDIIINHPELVAELPNDATILEWGYEADHPFDEHCELFTRRAKANPKSRRELYVCPGTSSWLTFAGRSKNAFENIHNAARAGIKHNAKGILITDWGDRGHQQMLAISLTPMAYGAAASWNLSATPRSQDKKALAPQLRAISTHLFQDQTATIATLAYDLGLTYERLQCPRPNASADWFLFREPWEENDFVSRTPSKALTHTLNAVDKVHAGIFQTRLIHPDSQLITGEFFHAVRTIIGTCTRTLLRKTIQKQMATPRQREALRKKIRGRLLMSKATQGLFRFYWLQRNKPSRMRDVLREFQRHQAEYTRLLLQRQ